MVKKEEEGFSHFFLNSSFFTKEKFANNDPKRDYFCLLCSMVARFFLTQYTTAGKIYQITTTVPNGHKYTKWL
jgi:hypothetical protein